MLLKRKTNLAIILTSLVLGACSSQMNTVQNQPSKGERTLKIMTYNIHHANPPSKAKEGLIDVDAIAEVIKKQNPDLVGLQELDKNTKRSGNIDEAALIAQKTGMNYRFFKAIDYDGGEYGIAILSKFNIDDATKIDLPQPVKGESRVLGYITIKIRGVGNVTFADTHLDTQRPDENRLAEMKRIVDELGKKTGPVILVGDLNCEASSAPIHILDQSFKRSCINGCPLTIPELTPLKTIDYITVNKNTKWPVASHQVIAETYASDHRPVVASFVLK